MFRSIVSRSRAAEVSFSLEQSKRLHFGLGRAMAKGKMKKSLYCRNSSDFARCSSRSVFAHQGVERNDPGILFLHLLFSRRPSRPKRQIKRRCCWQSGIDAENRKDLDRAWSNFARFQNWIRLRRKLFSASATLISNILRLSQPPDLSCAAELSPDSIPIHQLLGYALLALKFAAEAILIFEVARDPGAFGNQQAAGKRPARWCDGVNLQSALENHPDNPDLLLCAPRRNGCGFAINRQTACGGFKLCASAPQARGQSVVTEEDDSQSGMSNGVALNSAIAWTAWPAPRTSNSASGAC